MSENEKKDSVAKMIEKINAYGGAPIPFPLEGI